MRRTAALALAWVFAFASVLQPAWAADKVPIGIYSGKQKEFPAGDRVGVANGGTGATTLTSHGVLVGQGTGAVAATAAGTSGKPLVSGGASADPSYATLGVSGGGTNAATASGTSLDNITGFASTGFLTRTGAGTYAFQSTTNGVTLGNLAQVGANTMLGNWSGSTANVTANTMPSCADTGGNHLNYVNGTGITCGTTGGSSLTFKDEGSTLTTAATSVDCVGAGVVCTNTGGAVTMTISGGSITTAVPGTIPDLVFWFETDNILATATYSVPALLNRTPAYQGSNGSAQSTGALVSASTLNGLPVITFAGTSAGRYVSAAVNAYGAGATVFVVFKPNTVAGGTSGTFVGGTPNGLQFHTVAANLRITKTNVAVIATDTTTLSTSTWVQANVTYLPSSGAYAFRVSRAASSSGTNVMALASGNSVFGYNAANNAEDLNSQVAAIIAYDRVLTSGEITAVENYLNTKWGV